LAHPSNRTLEISSNEFHYHSRRSNNLKQKFRQWVRRTTNQ
jgi:hypothetical protein